jgi:hypothetical protein
VRRTRVSLPAPGKRPEIAGCDTAACGNEGLDVRLTPARNRFHVERYVDLVTDDHAASLKRLIPN